MEETRKLAIAEFKRTTRPRYEKGDIIEYNGKKYRVTKVLCQTEEKTKLEVELIE